MQRVLVSACLLGEAVRYNGSDRRCEHAILQGWLSEGRVVPICPEVAAGMPVPRPPSEISGGAGGLKVIAGSARVIEPDGNDVTAIFIEGARRALELARSHGIRVAVLKESSPSCGSASIHDGQFAGRQLPGQGVTTAMLQQAGIAVFSEEQLAEANILLGAFESAH